MTKDELKKNKTKPEPIVSPKYFDLSTAQRVIISKEELKAMEEAELEKRRAV